MGCNAGPTICSAYDHEQFTQYLQQLQTHITVRTSLLLSSNNHTINLSFDPEEALQSQEGPNNWAAIHHVTPEKAKMINAWGEFIISCCEQ